MNCSTKLVLTDTLYSPVMEPMATVLSGYLTFALKMILNPVLGATGLCSNIINAAVFFKMGLSDGVSQNFFILSISDGILACVSTVQNVSYVLMKIVRTTIGSESLDISLQQVNQASYFAPLFPMCLSVITTVMIAVVRCCSVAMPLKVKHLITARRQLSSILVFQGIACGILVFSLSPMQMFLVPNPQTNSSTVWYGGLHWPVYIAVYNTVLFGGWIVLSVCVIILSVSLKRASKFRDGSTAVSSISGKHNTLDPAISTKETKPKERKRDLRIVRTVVFVCVVYIACTVPSCVFLILRNFVEGMTLFGKYVNAYRFSLALSETSTMLNVSLNIFIYFFTNTRFRVTFFILFGKE